jgi:hypothetical protein
MARDRSLDEFFGESAASGSDDDADDADDARSDAGSDPDADAEGDANADAGAEGTDSVDAPADVEPAAVTYRWDPDGAGCAECGATVDRLWSGVCADCKEW